jgi:hypothetical protein
MPCEDCTCECVKKLKRDLRQQGKKKCRKCDEIKPINMFDKKRAECKECRKNKNSLYYYGKTKKKNEALKKIDLLQQFIDMEELKDIKNLILERAKNII